ncbi:MAG: DDE transposase, partial [Planctomycetota bacterium]
EVQAAKREEQAAVYRNRRRAKGAGSKRLHRKRGELVERAFEHVLDDGGMRRVHLKGRENVHKRYLIHVAGF